MKQELKETKQEDKKQHIKIIRILSTDIEGNKAIDIGLSKIKGINYSLANAICKKLKIDINRKIQELEQEEIKKITDFLENPELPNFLFNRRKDIETGKNIHLIGSDLSLQKEFDIKRLKKIKSYKGIRHGAGLPVRGQKTKANFRKNKTLGVSKRKKLQKK